MFVLCARFLREDLHTIGFSWVFFAYFVAYVANLHNYPRTWNR